MGVYYNSILFHNEIQLILRVYTFNSYFIKSLSRLQISSHFGLHCKNISKAKYPHFNSFVHGTQPYKLIGYFEFTLSRFFT